MSAQVLKDLKTFSDAPATLLPHPLYDNFGDAVDVLTARKVLADKYQLHIAQDDKVLLFFGLIRQYKGLDLLLEALQLVKDPNIKLLIAGEYYDDPQKYAAFLQHPAVAGRILLHANFVTNDDVKYFVCASDCVVQPYRSATQSGVTPVAYHFEVPMIVTNVGGLPEMVPHEKAGLVCAPNAPDIAAAIEQYFERGKAFFMPGLLEEKKKLSWQKLVANIIE
jgi:glycosyltransferase involved in cell wall biosynthesis